MNSTLPTSAREVLWGDFQPEHTFPAKRRLLAHYTSVATLEKILTSNEVWLSNPLYMNDWEELRFGMNAGADAFRTNSALRKACGLPEDYSLLVSSFTKLFNDFDERHVLDTYVLCLSEHEPEDNDGLLSMWRGYGMNGGGVAAVVDTEQLPHVMGSPLIVGKVTYRSRQERDEWIDRKLVALAEVISAHDSTEQNITFLAHAWFERLKVFALFSKHKGFSEEREWRVVYRSELDMQGLAARMLGYAITSKGVEPKLKLSIDEISRATDGKFSFDNLIERIILGPSISTLLAEMSVRRMLELARPALASKVVASRIPFRP